MFKGNKIPLFWWSEVYLMNKQKENYGDLLGKYLVEKITGKEAVFKHTKKAHIFDTKKVLVTIGSILANVNQRCVVWGSGIISKNDDVKKATFLAVRGPQTRAFLLDKGYVVPEVYGDPALLLPDYYNPEIEKEYDLGIIPHYADFKLVNEWFENESKIKVIDLMTLSIEHTTDTILKCHKIVSSSLHGVILAHAYGIPAVWQKFSDNLYGDDIKFQDYFESVLIDNYTLEIMSSKPIIQNLEGLFNQVVVLPNQEHLTELKAKLLATFPEVN